MVACRLVSPLLLCRNSELRQINCFSRRDKEQETIDDAHQSPLKCRVRREVAVRVQQYIEIMRKVTRTQTIRRQFLPSVLAHVLVPVYGVWLDTACIWCGKLIIT